MGQKVNFAEFAALARKTTCSLLQRRLQRCKLASERVVFLNVRASTRLQVSARAAELASANGNRAELIGFISLEHKATSLCVSKRVDVIEGAAEPTFG